MTGERAEIVEPPISADDPMLVEIVRRLVAAYHPERICLFGSKARGEAGPDSDYDLMVVVPDSASPERRGQPSRLRGALGHGDGRRCPGVDPPSLRLSTTSQGLVTVHYPGGGEVALRNTALLARLSGAPPRRIIPLTAPHRYPDLPVGMVDLPPPQVPATAILAVEEGRDDPEAHY